LRTKEHKEVDFVLVNDKKIEQMIEVKLSDNALSPNLCYFHGKYGFPAVQIVKELKREKREGKIELLRAEQFLKQLDL